MKSADAREFGGWYEWTGAVSLVNRDTFRQDACAEAEEERQKTIHHKDTEEWKEEIFAEGRNEHSEGVFFDRKVFSFFL